MDSALLHEDMHLTIIGRKDDADLSTLQDEMQNAGHTSTWVDGVAEPGHIFWDLSPDALLIDLSRDGLDPERVLAIVAEAHRDGYVLALGLVTPRDIGAFDPSLGLDDFLLRPTRAEEVLARIRQAHWRHRPLENEGKALRQGDLVIDLERYEVRVGSREVTLTFKEFELLRLLASNAGRVFTREVLLDRIWGYDYIGGTRTVDVHVRRLRGKLEDGTHTFVETVRNVGYRLKPD